jgi:hypothetical protein
MRIARALGGAAGSTLALGLLVCCCVAIAVAGPSLSLRFRTDALQQQLGQLGPLGTAVQVTGDGPRFAQDFSGNPVLTENDLNLATSEIGDSLRSSLPIGAGAWGGLTTTIFTVKSGVQLPGGRVPQLEVTYRNNLPDNAKVVAGEITSGPIPDGALAVTVSQPTATQFGLRPGSRLTLNTPGGKIRLLVTGVVRERRPSSSTFWSADTLAANPALVDEGGPEFVQGAAFADPGQLQAMQRAFCKRLGYCDALRLQWQYPVLTRGVTADQAQALSTALQQGSSTLSDQLGSAATDVTISSPLTSALATFLATQTAILAVLLLLLISLVAIGAVVIILAGRMIVTRRDGELRMLHARGAAGHQVALLVLRGVALGAIPGAVIGAALGSLTAIGSGTVPGGNNRLGWELAAIALTAGLAGPVAVASWRHRRSSPVVNPARVLTAETRTPRFAGPTLRRLTASVTVCVAAVAALYVLHQQGVPPGATNWFLTVAPLLAAAPAALLAMYLYPVAVRGLLWAFRRGTRATSYIAFASAAAGGPGQSSTARAPVATAYALVLALTLAAFGGMVHDGIDEGQSIASWQVTGADAVIGNGPAAVPIGPAVVRAVAAVPGVRQAAAVWETTWNAPDGTGLVADAVDPAAYQALTQDTPFPSVPAAAMGTSAQPARPGTVISVLASPQAATALGAGPVQLTSATDLGGPIQVRITGTVPTTPAEPGGGSFLLMALRTLPGAGGSPAPNRILVVGSGLDQARLTTVVNRTLPGATITYRSAVSAALRAAPLPRAGVLLILLSVIAATALGLASLVLGLAFGARERRLTLARLSVMGHERDAWFALLCGLPAVLMAIIAAAACALTLPGLIGANLDLSAFTGSGAAVPLRPGLSLFGLAAVVAVLVAGIALVADARRSRGNGVTGVLRAE